MVDAKDSFELDENDLVIKYIQADGPGGQNVNKVATAVELRFDAAHAAGLTADVRGRLLKLAGTRATAEGVIILFARRFRTREANRLDAISRLKALIARAEQPPKIRRATRPSNAARAERLTEKRRRSAVKDNRTSRAYREEEE